MYWETRFPRLLTTTQLQDLINEGRPLVGICYITCDLKVVLDVAAKGQASYFVVRNSFFVKARIA
ncbi:hypothetical protein ACS0TY_014241 [Phlomoides rotata]